MLDGDITSATFASERFLDADVIDLMAKITLREDPEFTRQYPAKWNCRIVAETLAGVRHEVHVAYPKYIRKIPFRMPRSKRSFYDWLNRYWECRCRAFLEWAWRLEEADNIGEMFPLLAIP